MSNKNHKEEINLLNESQYSKINSRINQENEINNSKNFSQFDFNNNNSLKKLSSNKELIKNEEIFSKKSNSKPLEKPKEDSMEINNLKGNLILYQNFF